MYYPHAFRVSYEDDYHHRIATCGGMDSEYSHTTREPRSEIVVAPDLETAQFLWTKRLGCIKSRTKIEWEELGSVTLMVSGITGL